ncbi:hypothetical protein DSM104299_00117 [Baekduia alba]|uniref:hypothetical protein n=1 Tax=Baekduia alba TaxID=2997333 RepID=UPI002341C377|nr:hypothetical protein [Baekduia alba]WCB91446.1 hypothetical protein DSM104299_00117 [Baekduia alba]
MRYRFALALMVAGLLFSAGIASAQSTTTTGTGTDPTSGYTQTQTQTETTSPTTTTQTTKPSTQEGTGVAPAVAAQPAASAPSSLAFTGGEPLLLIIAGLAIAGGTATLLVRDRRRNQN